MGDWWLPRLGKWAGRIVSIALLSAGVLIAVGLLRLAWVFACWTFTR